MSMLYSAVQAQSSRVLRRRVRVMRGPKASRQNEVWYRAQLLELVRDLKLVANRELVPLLQQLSPLWTKDGAPRGVVGDGYSSDINDRIDRMAAQFGGMRQRANALARMAARRSLDSTDKQLVDSIKRSVRVDITGLLADSAVAEVMDRNVISNVNLITSIPEQFLQRVRTEVFSGVQTGQRWEEIANRIADTVDVTASRAKLIARDQVSKMNATFNEARQTSLGIEEYVWAGAMDERERPSHVANEGKTFRWDSPPPNTGHPGDDINCRCVALPKFDLDKAEKRLGIA